MTLKTLVMMLKTQLCITGINYIHIVKRYFKFKSYFTILLIYWINYWSNKCSLGDRQSESVQKHKKFTRSIVYIIFHLFTVFRL